MLKNIDALPHIPDACGRFILRAFVQEDRDALVRHINSSKIAKRVTKVPTPYTARHADQWLQHLADEVANFHFSHRIDFAISIHDEVVGSIAFINIDGHKAQISYWLGEEFQGKGIMTDALKLVVQYGQENCEFVRIWAYTWDNNTSSQRVLEKAGFSREGVHKKEWVKDGVFHDSIMFAVVKDA